MNTVTNAKLNQLFTLKLLPFIVLKRRSDGMSPTRTTDQGKMVNVEGKLIPFTGVIYAMVTGCDADEHGVPESEYRAMLEHCINQSKGALLCQ